jgi:hypothetical protein
MIRIHCDNYAEADAAWRMLQHVPDHDLPPATIQVNGVAVAFIGLEAQPVAQRAHTFPQAAAAPV